MTSSKLDTAQKALVEEHLYLVDQIIKYEFFVSYTNVEMNIDDLTQMGSLALCNAALKYDNKRPFAPFARAVIRNALFDYARRLKLQRQTLCYLTDEMEASLSYHQEYSETEDYLKLLEENASGTSRKGLFALRMNLNGYTAVDLSRIFGVTPSAVGSWLRNSRETLRTDPDLYQLLS